MPGASMGSPHACPQPAGHLARAVNPLKHHLQAIGAVYGHVDEQSCRHDSHRLKCQAYKVGHDGRVTVQWMKPNTAALWVKYRISQQMIEIHYHGGEHDHPGIAPAGTKKNHCHEPWHQQMPSHMYRSSNHRTTQGRVVCNRKVLIGVKRWRLVDAGADDSALAGDAKAATTINESDKAPNHNRI